MNKYDFLTSRKRRQSLFIVEGNHEKDKLVHLLIKAFPELDIQEENIIIYGTNIYALHRDIEKNYGKQWDTTDIDLAYIVSKKKRNPIPLTMEEFNNIIIIFDYERHDPNFSETIICQMQSYFNNSTDVGKLYINYPMIESYQHFNGWPNNDFLDLSVSVLLQPGRKYKNLVKDTMSSKHIALPEKLQNILQDRFHIKDETVCLACTEKTLLVSSLNEIEKCVSEELGSYLSKKDIKTVSYQFKFEIDNLKYFVQSDNYYSYIRKLFIDIIWYNFLKAKKIIGIPYDIEEDKQNYTYDDINLLDILNAQNKCSRNIQDGFIWVLNTSILFVPDNNPALICAIK